MKKFVFNLQSILRLKENEEDAEKKLLRLLEAKRMELMIAREELNITRLKNQKKMKSSISEGTNSLNLSSYSRFIKEIEKQIEKKTEEIKVMDIRVEKQVEVLLAIKTEIKSLEKLREKQEKAFIVQQNKRQEIAIEDFIAGRRAFAMS